MFHLCLFASARALPPTGATRPQAALHSPVTVTLFAPPNPGRFLCPKPPLPQRRCHHLGPAVCFRVHVGFLRTSAFLQRTRPSFEAHMVLGRKRQRTRPRFSTPRDPNTSRPPPRDTCPTHRGNYPLPQEPVRNLNTFALLTCHLSNKFSDV